MRVVAIIQARMGSTRLPGKVLKILQGKSVLTHVVERVSACDEVDVVVVATTDCNRDDSIVSECVNQGVNYFRGSENDVLDRYYKAAQYYNADIIVRVTSDCPLFSPAVLRDMLKDFTNPLQGNIKPDYLSNTLQRTFPRGLDAEVMSITALMKTWSEAEEPYEREHVTPYIYNHPELFELMGFEAKQNYSSMRWTLDTHEDWCFIKEIFDHCYSGDGIFSSEDVINFLIQEPHLKKINASVCQKSLTG